MNQVASPSSANWEIDAKPYASALVEGHRNFGYSLETALSDIVDDSISAGERNVNVVAETVAEDPWIAVADDGCGVVEEELMDAMCLGSRNPTDASPAGDLG